jgi:methyltransferase
VPDARLVFLALVGALMLGEALWSRRNEGLLRQQGAAEPDDDVYRWMLVAYPGSFAAMGVEAFTVPAAGLPLAGAACLVVAKALKYWAIGSLGYRWCFRVLVPPGSLPLAGGPYRWIQHPNYVAIVLELLATAMFLGAWRSGPFVMAGFVWLMWRRIAVEERALGLR